MGQPSFNVLGVCVSAVDMAAALAAIEGWISEREQHYVCVTGVHGVMESRRDDRLRAIHNAAGMVTPDGMPLVWCGRLSGHGQIRRVYGPDLMLACCGLTARHRHFLYGGAPGVAERLADRLRQRFPSLVIAGTYTPPFRALTLAEDEVAVTQINASAADIVWVGLSTPKQERWMAAHMGRVDAPVMIGVGAAFDFLSGIKRQAPRWMQRTGLEWLFRLAAEPRRLWRRYLRNNPLFLWYLFRQALGLDHYAHPGRSTDRVEMAD